MINLYQLHLLLFKVVNFMDKCNNAKVKTTIIYRYQPPCDTHTSQKHDY